jgi:hypothetical protein
MVAGSTSIASSSEFISLDTGLRVTQFPFFLADVPSLLINRPASVLDLGNQPLSARSSSGPGR